MEQKDPELNECRGVSKIRTVQSFNAEREIKFRAQREQMPSYYNVNHKV